MKKEMINTIESIAKKLNIEIESYTVFDSNYNRESVDSLHTDTSVFLDFGVCAKSDAEIADWDIIEPDAYNRTINANNGITQTEPVLVVVIKKDKRK